MYADLWLVFQLFCYDTDFRWAFLLINFVLWWLLLYIIHAGYSPWPILIFFHPSQCPSFLQISFPYLIAFVLFSVPPGSWKAAFSPGLGGGACCTAHPRQVGTEKDWAAYSWVHIITYGPSTKPSSARAYSSTWGHHHLLPTHLPLPKMSVTAGPWA